MGWETPPPEHQPVLVLAFLLPEFSVVWGGTPKQPPNNWRSAKLLQPAFFVLLLPSYFGATSSAIQHFCLNNKGRLLESSFCLAPAPLFGHCRRQGPSQVVFFGGLCLVCVVVWGGKYSHTVWGPGNRLRPHADPGRRQPRGGRHPPRAARPPAGPGPAAQPPARPGRVDPRRPGQRGRPAHHAPGSRRSGG